MEDEISAPVYFMIDDFEQISRPINTSRKPGKTSQKRRTTAEFTEEHGVFC
jgi:hypothetical protein